MELERQTVKPQRGAHAHRIVAEAAKGLAGELYDVLMHNDKLFAEWKRQHPHLASNSKALERAFIKRNWGRCLEGARTTLALMLSRPGNEELKDQISEALILDAGLVKGRTANN